MNKVVAILGSKRKNGNSNYVVDKILSEIKVDNVLIKKYNLGDLNINPCQGCFACRKLDNCIIDDDMNKIIEDIKDADKIIISIPIFMYQMPGDLKQLVDRLYPILDGANGKYTKKYGNKDTILVYSQGASKENQFQDYIDINKRTFELLGLHVVETLVCTGANQIGSAKENLEICERAKSIGENLFQ